MPLSRTHLHFAHFTASEAARITGVQPGAQRDWRRRGLLPSTDGWSVYFANNLIEMSLRRVMGELGMPHVDATLDLSAAVMASQAWAATHAKSTSYEDGLTPSSDQQIGPPQFRYAWASSPWANTVGLCLAEDFAALQAVIEKNPTSAGGGLIDLREIGWQVAAKAGEPLWYVRQGPGPGEVTEALNRASRGDIKAQAALSEIGIHEWSTSGE